MWLPQKWLLPRSTDVGDREASHALVQRRLRHAVRVPAAQLVVRDRAHPRRDRAEGIPEDCHHVDTYTTVA